VKDRVFFKEIPESLHLADCDFDRRSAGFGDFLRLRRSECDSYEEAGRGTVRLLPWQGKLLLREKTGTAKKLLPTRQTETGFLSGRWRMFVRLERSHRPSIRSNAKPGN
jgi:hypothetical protein